MSNILVLVVELWYRQPRYVEWATIKENCLELLLNSKYMFFEFFSTFDFHKIKEKEFKKTNCNSSPCVYIHPELALF